jgi:hypothetical protein
MPDVTPLYQPGEQKTVLASGAALTGGRFVMLAATKADSAAIPAKAPTGSTVPVLGVTNSDAAQNAHTTITNTGVIPVEVGTGGVTAGDVLMVDTAGRVVTQTSTNVKVGLALTTTAAAGFALVDLDAKV